MFHLLLQNTVVKPILKFTFGENMQIVLFIRESM